MHASDREVALDREDGQPLGIRFIGSDDLTVVAVRASSPAAAAGLHELLRWRLTHVAQRPVKNVNMVAAAISGSTRGLVMKFHGPVLAGSGDYMVGSEYQPVHAAQTFVSPQLSMLVPGDCVAVAQVMHLGDEEWLRLLAAESAPSEQWVMANDSSGRKLRLLPNGCAKPSTAAARPPRGCRLALSEPDPSRHSAGTRQSSAPPGPPAGRGRGRGRRQLRPDTALPPPGYGRGRGRAHSSPIDRIDCGAPPDSDVLLSAQSGPEPARDSDPPWPPPPFLTPPPPHVVVPDSEQISEPELSSEAEDDMARDLRELAGMLRTRADSPAPVEAHPRAELRRSAPPEPPRRTRAKIPLPRPRDAAGGPEGSADGGPPPAELAPPEVLSPPPPRPALCPPPRLTPKKCVGPAPPTAGRGLWLPVKSATPARLPLTRPLPTAPAAAADDAPAPVQARPGSPVPAHAVPLARAAQRKSIAALPKARPVQPRRPPSEGAAAAATLPRALPAAPASDAEAEGSASPGQPRPATSAGLTNARGATVAEMAGGAGAAEAAERCIKAAAGGTGTAAVDVAMAAAAILRQHPNAPPRAAIPATKAVTAAPGSPAAADPAEAAPVATKPKLAPLKTAAEPKVAPPKPAAAPAAAAAAAAAAVTAASAQPEAGTKGRAQAAAASEPPLPSEETAVAAPSRPTASIRLGAHTAAVAAVSAAAAAQAAAAHAAAVRAPSTSRAAAAVGAAGSAVAVVAGAAAAAAVVPRSVATAARSPPAVAAPAPAGTVAKAPAAVTPAAPLAVSTKPAPKVAARRALPTAEQQAAPTKYPPTSKPVVRATAVTSAGSQQVPRAVAVDPFAFDELTGEAQTAGASGPEAALRAADTQVTAPLVAHPVRPAPSAGAVPAESAAPPKRMPQQRSPRSSSPATEAAPPRTQQNGGPQAAASRPPRKRSRSRGRGAAKSSRSSSRPRSRRRGKSRTRKRRRRSTPKKRRRSVSCRRSSSRHRRRSTSRRPDRRQPSRDGQLSRARRRTPWKPSDRRKRSDSRGKPRKRSRSRPTHRRSRSRSRHTYRRSRSRSRPPPSNGPPPASRSRRPRSSSRPRKRSPRSGSRRRGGCALSAPPGCGSRARSPSPAERRRRNKSRSRSPNRPRTGSRLGAPSRGKKSRSRSRSRSLKKSHGSSTNGSRSRSPGRGSRPAGVPRDASSAGKPPADTSAPPAKRRRRRAGSSSPASATPAPRPAPQPPPRPPPRPPKPHRAAGRATVAAALCAVAAVSRTASATRVGPPRLLQERLLQERLLLERRTSVRRLAETAAVCGAAWVAIITGFDQDGWVEKVAGVLTRRGVQNTTAPSAAPPSTTACSDKGSGASAERPDSQTSQRAASSVRAGEDDELFPWPSSPSSEAEPSPRRRSAAARKAGRPPPATSGVPRPADEAKTTVGPGAASGPEGAAPKAAAAEERARAAEDHAQTPAPSSAPPPAAAPEREAARTAEDPPAAPAKAPPCQATAAEQEEAPPEGGPTGHGDTQEAAAAVPPRKSPEVSLASKRQRPRQREGASERRAEKKKLRKMKKASTAMRRAAAAAETNSKQASQPSTEAAERVSGTNQSSSAPTTAPATSCMSAAERRLRELCIADSARRHPCAGQAHGWAGEVVSGVRGSWVFEERIGWGSFSDVYAGRSRGDDEIQEVCFKVEPQNSSLIPVLAQEHEILKSIAGSDSERRTPEPLHLKATRRHHILVLERLGPSVSALFHVKGKCFSQGTAAWLAREVIECLRVVHSHGYVHRDVSPGNFCLARGGSCLFVIDFGLARKYRGRSGAHRTNFEDGKAADRRQCGTPAFLSLNVHRGEAPTRRDDLEAAALLCLFLARGNLPWAEQRDFRKRAEREHLAEPEGEELSSRPRAKRGKEGSRQREQQRQARRAAMVKAKESWTPQRLGNGLHPCFAQFLTMCRELEFAADPDYDRMRSLFDPLAAAPQDLDWETTGS
eukprot:TRINITY_DN8568_c0_g1_i1.p1 TRINITY_DN8568_c0_g1~~TRINITY_DN8568_c0_g1_i1.p1  ORF type:complete len:1968 (+),score=141.46 TRINITY_DN8568_c0_g1_i1:83-5986(+)